VPGRTPARYPRHMTDR